MHDMHCHLAFMANGEEVAADAQTAGTMLFANTVTPDEYESARSRFGGYGNVRVGLGMHPWWADGSFDPERFAQMAAHERFIGEIGLDLGRRHQDNRDAQIGAFAALVGICARQGGKVMSLHAVHASTEVLDELDRAGALETCTCIFHWFTGPSDVLKRAIQAGCYFSTGPRMLATGKGREYAKAIPAERLLLETDAPPVQGQRYSYEELRTELGSAAGTVASIKGERALEVIEQNARLLMA